MKKYMNGHTKNSRRGAHSKPYCTMCGGRGKCQDSDIPRGERKALKKVKHFREKYSLKECKRKWLELHGHI